MAEAKQLKALRITSKHGTEAQWKALETPYIPNSGEIIVFDADSNFTEPRIKVGDGVSSAIELPFVSASEIYIGTEQPVDDSSYKIFIKTDEDYGAEQTSEVQKTYRHYIQLKLVTNEFFFYDFSSNKEVAYTKETLPVMPDNAAAHFTYSVSNHLSSVNGQVYRDTDNILKIIAHGLYTEDGTTVKYLERMGTEISELTDDVVEL